MQHFRVICLNLPKGQYVACGGLSIYGILQMQANIYVKFTNGIPVCGLVSSTFFSGGTKTV